MCEKTSVGRLITIHAAGNPIMPHLHTTRFSLQCSYKEKKRMRCGMFDEKALPDTCSLTVAAAALTTRKRACSKLPRRLATSIDCTPPSPPSDRPLFPTPLTVYFLLYCGKLESSIDIPHTHNSICNPILTLDILPRCLCQTSSPSPTATSRTSES